VNPEQRKDTVAAAVQAELEAYRTMRDLVPDLALPVTERPALTRRQQKAFTDYTQARERLRLARAASSTDPS
jgi:hypothetical protein